MYFSLKMYIFFRENWLEIRLKPRLDGAHILGGIWGRRKPRRETPCSATRKKRERGVEKWEWKDRVGRWKWIIIPWQFDSLWVGSPKSTRSLSSKLLIRYVTIPSLGSKTCGFDKTVPVDISNLYLSDIPPWTSVLSFYLPSTTSIHVFMRFVSDFCDLLHAVVLLLSVEHCIQVDSTNNNYSHKTRTTAVWR